MITEPKSVDDLIALIESAYHGNFSHDDIHSVNYYATPYYPLIYDQISHIDTKGLKVPAITGTTKEEVYPQIQKAYAEFRQFVDNWNAAKVGGVMLPASGYQTISPEQHSAMMQTILADVKAGKLPKEKADEINLSHEKTDIDDCLLQS